MPSGPTSRLPLRKSPWTTRRTRRRRAGSAPASAVPARGPGCSPRRSRGRRAAARGSRGVSSPSTSPESGSRAPGEDFPAALGQARADVGVRVVAQDAAGNVSPSTKLHHDEGGVESGGVAAVGDQLRHRHAGARRRFDRGRLAPHRLSSPVRLRWVAAQDQRSLGATGEDRVEGPGLAAGAAGQPPQVAHLDLRLRARVRHHGAQLLGELLRRRGNHHRSGRSRRCGTRSPS